MDEEEISVVQPRQSVRAIYLPPKASSHTVKSFMPADVKKRIAQILNKSTDGISSSDFLSAYKTEFKEELNFQSMGFWTLKDCLSSIPNIEFKYVNRKLRFFSVSLDEKQSNAERTEASSLKNFFDENLQLVLTDFDTSRVSESMKENFKTILQSSPQGITEPNFLKSYEELTQHQLNLADLGCFSLVELANSLPKIFKPVSSEMYGNNALLFHGTSTEKIYLSDGIEEAPRCDFVCQSSNIDCVVKNIRTLLRGHPQGVFLSHFINLYSLNYEEPLPLLEFGWSNIEDFLLQICNRVPLKIDDIQKKVYLTNGLLPVCKRNTTSVSHMDMNPTNGIVSEDWRNNLNMKSSTPLQKPDDAVLPGLTYSAQTLPQDSYNKYIPMYTTTILDPSLIWIQLVGEETTHALDSLLDEIDDFYRSPKGDDYIMEHSHIKKGTICAGIWDYDKMWYRITITEANSGLDFVDAFFVDYGTESQIPRKNLRYLRKKFLHLPAQAMKSRMAFIMPKNGFAWDKEIYSRLMTSCNQKIIMGEIIKNNLYPDFLSLWLCDPSQDKYDDINISLIEEGFAVCDPQDGDSFKFKIHQRSKHTVQQQYLSKTLQQPGLLTTISPPRLPTTGLQPSASSLHLCHE